MRDVNAERLVDYPPNTMSPEEVLYAAAGFRTVDLVGISMFVVTGTHTPGPEEPQEWPFTPGEIVLVDMNKPGATSRTDTPEMFGDRDLYRWHTSVLHYCTTDITQARKLQALVASGAARGVYRWDPVTRGWFGARDQVEAMHRLCSTGGEGEEVFVGDTDHHNTWGEDIAYPGNPKYAWPTDVTKR
jgi:hypothetical protein